MEVILDKQYLQGIMGFASPISEDVCDKILFTIYTAF